MSDIPYNININISEEQFKALWDLYPHDENLIAEVCRRELYNFHIPNKTGRTQSGVRVYYDDGWMGSGYLLVHWDDAKRVGWAQDNGYMRNGMPESEKPIIWDDQPERERIIDIRKTLQQWA